MTQPGMEAYPMDYYAKEGGVWNSSYHKPSRNRNAHVQTSSAPQVLSAA